jgi:alpha-2-macroglobulin
MKAIANRLLGSRLIGLSLTALAIVMLLKLTGCGVVQLTPMPMPSVAEIAAVQLPDWIEQISPTGEAKPLDQIRIRFKEPLIPIERLDSPDQQALLQQFELLPPLPGQFRFLTPRMVGFQADQAIPKATRVQVKLKAGLKDLKNHRLDRDFAWTFTTARIQLTNLPSTSPEGAEAFELKPRLNVTANTELDLNSVKEHAQLVAEGAKTGVPLKVMLDQPESVKPADNPTDPFDANRTWIYRLEPEQPLEKAKRYKLEFTPGLRSRLGNLPSENSFVSQIETYAPLALQKLNFTGKPDANGTYGRFVPGSAELLFNNPVDPEAAVANITVDPAPKPEPPLVKAYAGEKTISLNPWALEPNQTYRITIGANLKDKFGQTLGKSVTLPYQTGDAAGDLWLPKGVNILPASHDVQLNIAAINLPESQYKAAFTVVQPTDLVYIEPSYLDDTGNGLLPKLTTWPTYPVKSERNRSTEIPVPLRQQLGAATGMLAYGVQARTNRYEENGQQKWREPIFTGLVQLTNLGVFSQWFPESGLVRVHRLSDGAAVSEATIAIYRANPEANVKPQPIPCATGKTDRAGTWQPSPAALQTCLTGGAEAPKLLTIARVNQDWAFAYSREYSGTYEYGLENAGWQSSKPVSRGTVFSDRQLYQPGETAYLTGAAYYLKNGKLQQDKNTPYSITLEPPNGKKTELGKQTTTEFGTFSLKLPLAVDQPLGEYVIKAKSTAGVELTGNFRVAEFKPPNFKVELKVEPEFAIAEQKVVANAQSNYLFGAPVEGGRASFYVTRQPQEFTPKGWEQFSFGRRWFYPEERPEVTSDVLQGEQALNNQGQGSQQFTIDKTIPYAMTYRVDVQVADVSNLAVADSKSLMVLPSDRLIGLKTNFVADAGKAFPVEIIVTDPMGKVRAGETVKVELQAMQYSSVTRVVEGSRNQKSQVEYQTVAQAEVKSGDTPQTISLTPKVGGSYRIRANFANSGDENLATDQQIWVTGAEEIRWSDRYENNRLELTLDKATYKPGETATVLIQSPYPEAEVYLAVVRHKTLYQTVTKVKGGAPQIQFPVTPEMLPNAAVEAVLVRQGKPLEQTEPGSLENLVKIGFAPFKTDLGDRYLQVETQLTESLPPGSEQTVQLQLKDAQGQPTQGHVTVMAVNEAVLQLSGYRVPDLVKLVYAEQPISTRIADNRPQVLLQPQASPLDKGWGYGGGSSSGSASTRIRTEFKPVAYYDSTITNKNGQATVKFKLPDDLTTWRVMTVATDSDLHFGNGDKTFITTKPLITNALLPQFARPGDRLNLGLSVTNNTGQNGKLVINGDISGGLQMADNQTATRQTDVAAGTQAYRFPVMVNGNGNGNSNGKVKFSTQLNGVADVFEMPVVVKPLELTEQVITAGTTTNQSKIPLNVDSNVAAGRLEISLASTLIPAITAPAEQVFSETHLPFLEPAASQLAIAANLQLLSRQFGQTWVNFNPNQQATLAIARLQKLQQPDGGFASYPGQKTADPLVTPLAAQALAQAQAAGLPVDADILTQLTAYLKKTLADPSKYDYCRTTNCKNQVRLASLMALAALGEQRNDFIADLYGQRQTFDLVMQIKLARYLTELPDWQPEAKTLTNQIQKSIYETGRNATVNLPSGWQWLSSATTVQSQAMQLMIAQKTKPEVVDRLLQGLLAQRRNGTWQTSYDNAEALNALVSYANLQPTPPNFKATAQLANQTLATAEFQGNQKPMVDVKIPIADLPKNRNDLVLKKSGQGVLHYLVAYRYRLPGNQPGRLNGLRVTRTMRPANQAKVLYKAALFAPDALTVPVGQVYDVGVEIITDHPVDHVVITDPLPAGFEAVDNSLQTATRYFQAKGDSWQVGYRTIYHDRIVAFGDRLEPGVYTLHYLVRSVTPGTFTWPGAEAHLQYAPEEFGRSASSTLIVAEK